MVGIENPSGLGGNQLLQRARELEEAGFVPPINSQNLPSEPQIRETLEEQYFLTMWNRRVRGFWGEERVMIPDSWMSLNTNTNFYDGKVEGGMVIWIDLLSKCDPQMQKKAHEDAMVLDTRRQFNYGTNKEAEDHLKGGIRPRRGIPH